MTVGLVGALWNFHESLWPTLNCGTTVYRKYSTVDYGFKLVLRLIYIITKNMCYLQSQKAVTAYLKGKQLMPFWFCKIIVSSKIFHSFKTKIP